jgi:hypothetical protein
VSRAALAREAAPAAKAAASTLRRAPSGDAHDHETERGGDRAPSQSRLSWSFGKVGVTAPGGCGTRCQCASCNSKHGAGSALGEGRALEGSARSEMERSFGRDFGDVRIHDGPAAARSAAQAGAGAYALGDHIVFGSGFYAPHSPGGRSILAHELAHVAQQSGGAASGGGSTAAAEAEAHRASASIRNGGAVQVRERTGLRPAAFSLGDARRELWSHVPDGVKDYVRPAARMAAAEMDKVIPPDTEIPKPVENLVRHPVDTAIAAVEHPIEAAKTVLQTAKEVAPVAKAAASKVVEHVKAKAKQEVHDVVMKNVGQLKGVVLEATNIVDTVAWLPYAAHEMEKAALGDSKAAQKILAASDAISGYASIQYLAEHGYAQLDPITHKPTGALNISDAVSGGIDKGAGVVNAALGGEQGGGGLGFTAYEQGELEGAIGTQVALSFVGVEEVQLVLKGVGLIGAVKGLVEAIEADPEGWKTSPNFWAGLINVGLNLVGLKSSLAAKKIVQMILAGGQLLTLTPVAMKLYHDYKTLPDGPERDKAVKQDYGALVKGVAGVIMAVAQGHGGKQAGEEHTGPGAAPAETPHANDNAPPTAHEAAPQHEAPAATTAAETGPAGEHPAAAPQADEHVAKSGAGHDEAAAVNKTDAQAEAPTGDGHEVIATPEGLGCCSPGPCPVIHVKYAKELAEHPALKARYEEIQQTRKTNPQKAASEAATLVKKLEELNAPPPTAAQRVMKAQGDNRSMTREQWKAAHGKERWKAAVDEAFEGDISDKTGVPRVTGGAKSGYRIDDTKVPGRPKPRVDVSASPDGRDTPLPLKEGETPREAVARVRQMIGRKISDFPALEKLWNKARADTLSRNQLTAENYGKLYDSTRDRFWGLVAADTPDGAAARTILDSAGMGFDAQGRAPTLEDVGTGVKRAETVVSLDHIEEKAQGDNWRKALDADNLNFEFARPNTNREVIQARHPELRQ